MLSNTTVCKFKKILADSTLVERIFSLLSVNNTTHFHFNF
jgi:hypothetical protein